MGGGGVDPEGKWVGGEEGRDVSGTGSTSGARTKL